MKYFIAILILLSALAVYAQELDTTYVVNEQGETIGLVHEKGTLDPNDSSAIYQDLIETNIERGTQQRSSGKAMMLGGGITFGIGTGIMIAGLANMKVGEDVDNSGAAVAYCSGILIMTAGEIVFTIGLIKKIIGGSKLRRAERYRQSLELYNIKHQHSLKMQVIPTIDPVHGTYGGNLAFSF